MSSLPMYFPQNFVLATANTCAALVNEAYDQVAQWTAQWYPDMGNFTWTTNLTGYTYSAPLYWTYVWPDYFGIPTTYEEPFGFVAVNASGTAYLVFRGTITDADEAQDATFTQTAYGLASGYGSVHSGFYEIYQSLSAQVHAALAALQASNPFTTLIFTGHSLGCGLSTLALPDVITNTAFTPSALTMLHYNLASPRVGNPVFADATNANGVPTWRIVNTEDIVPDGPLSVAGSLVYKHVGTPVDFTAQYGSILGNHSLTDSYIYALANPTDPEGPAATAPLGTVRLSPGVRIAAAVPPAAAAIVAGTGVHGR